MVDYKNMTTGDLERWADGEVRHDPKRSREPFEYLKHWLNVGRSFAYATPDDSWGEFEKLFSIIIRRLVVAERQTEEARSALRAIDFYHQEKHLPKTNEAFETLYVQTGKVARESLKKLE